jgi:uncharacterized protein GlcG (DUF336 family)
MVVTRKVRIVLLAALMILLITAALFLLPAARTQAQADHGPHLTQQDQEQIVAASVQAANSTLSIFRSDLSQTPPLKRPTKMVIAIVARDGKLLTVYSMPDAWVGSEDIAIAKARTAAFFSSDQNALTSRIIGEASQAHKPDGTGGAQPLWGIWASNQVGITGSPEFRNGIITFPGGIPLYIHGHLVGGVGVSGDGVDQDEYVAFQGAANYPPGPGVVTLGFTVPTVPPYP